MAHRPDRSASDRETELPEIELSGDPAGSDPRALPAVGDRYEDLGPLGVGGMGEVRRLHDRTLNRTVALKRMLRSPLAFPAQAARFVAEAQATAQLQHPSVVPLYDSGTDATGVPWFTMQEVRGEPLSDAIRALHRRAPDALPFRRLVAAFARVCHAVAYAHERGVLHRDLKPEHVLLGTHDEVWVMDWGLAKVLGPDAAPDGPEAPVVTWSPGDPYRTRDGLVAGTPAYMSPEQARGETHLADARTDVYGLGAVLYELLAGRPPFSGPDPALVVLRVSLGRRSPLPVAEPFAPAALVAACDRAMAVERHDRYPTAGALAADVEAWLDGAERRERALAIVDAALAREGEAEDLRARARALQAEGDAALAALDRRAPPEEKAPAWRLQDRAVELRRDADVAEEGIDQGLEGALRLAPDLAEAHTALLDRYEARHALAERELRADDAARLELRLRSHADALPTEHPRRVAALAWLRGDGALTLVTDPAGAEVRLFRCELRDRRRVDVEVGPLGRTPLLARELPRGSYVCELRAAGCATVRYPVEIRRMAHWDGRAPGERAPHPIWLPPADALGPDEVYVPAGWFRAGGDPRAIRAMPRLELWCDAFVIQRHHATNADYLAFLDDLVARGRADDASRFAPKVEVGTSNVPARMLYGFDGVRFGLVPDADGDVVEPDWPVVLIDRASAAAFHAWRAERTGRPWRLPAELEWEKAARGVDGRAYPWGDTYDPAWSRTYESARGRAHGDFGPASIAGYPVDTSAFGVRGCAGHVADWCLDPFDAADKIAGDRVLVPVPPAGHALYACRGGPWSGGPDDARISARWRWDPGQRHPIIGTRGLWRPDPDAERARNRSR